jgi:hypothetical protein
METEICKKEGKKMKLDEIQKKYGEIIEAHYRSFLNPKYIKIALGTTGKYGKTIHIHVLLNYEEKQDVSTLCGTGSSFGAGSYGYFPKINLYYKECNCKKCLKRLELLKNTKKE